MDENPYKAPLSPGEKLDRKLLLSVIARNAALFAAGVLIAVVGAGVIRVIVAVFLSPH